MNALPDLNLLSHAEKDELIRALFAHIQALTKQIEVLTEQNSVLTAKVAELEGRLSLNSKNSSKPPSMGGYGKPHHNRRSQSEADKKPKGGQPRHKGGTLKQSETPDHVVPCEPPTHCPDCQAQLPTGKVEEVRQVFDVPVKPFEVTEYRVVETQCACGRIHRGNFPEDVVGHVQYGPNIKAIVTHLVCHQMMPLKRTGQLMGDLFGLPMSESAILSALSEAKSKLTTTVNGIKDAITQANVVNADETGMHVSGKLYWTAFCRKIESPTTVRVTMKSSPKERRPIRKLPLPVSGANPSRARVETSWIG